MKKIDYTPQGVCTQRIQFELEEGKIHHVSFERGCPGNLQAIAKLVENRDAKEVAQLLKGNACGIKNTSCADQLAQAIEKALQEQS